MSLILEALRRSEAERKRGKAPSLLDAGPPIRARERPLWPIALAGLAVGLLIAAGVAWWVQRGAPLVPVAPMPASIPANATPVVAPTAIAPTTVAPETTAPMGIEPTPAPAIDAASAQATSPTQPLEATRASTSLPATMEPPVAPPQPDAAITPTALPRAPTPPTPAPLPSTVDPLLGPAPGDLAINELPATTRAALPPLRLSMHVFNDDPAQRFAIVDGARVREGDALGDAQVIEIRRDGLRLSWQGRTLWLPR